MTHSPEVRFSAISAGHLCLDIIPDLKNFNAQTFSNSFKPGRLLKVGSMSFSTGGSVSNSGLALHKLGVKTHLIAKLGADPYGETVKSIIQNTSAQLLDGVILKPRYRTSYTLIFNVKGMDRIFMHNPGSNDHFYADDVSDSTLHKAGLFHFGYPQLMRSMFMDQGTELMRIFQKAKAVDLTTTLDFCFPDPTEESGKADWIEILSKTLPYVDIALPSIEELILCLEPDLFHEMVQKGDIIAQIDDEMLYDLSQCLLDMGCAVVVLKLGERGLYLRSANKERIEQMGKAKPTPDWADLTLKQPCFKVEVAGSSGAGDTAIAGFIAALLRSLTAQQCLRYAAAAGASCCEQIDTLSGLQTWEQLTERIACGWEQYEN